jgi:hypothetical protein
MSIKKAIRKLKKLPKNIKKIPKKVVKPVLTFLKKLFDTIKRPILATIKKVVSGFLLIFFYIKCTLKMTKNFYKCAIFYILDIVKYLIIYVPILILLTVVGLIKEWTKIKPILDKYLQWPNHIMNDCYRCKNKKAKDIDIAKQFQKVFARDETTGESGFNFFLFLQICLIVFGFGYTVWHMLIREKPL